MKDRILELIGQGLKQSDIARIVKDEFSVDNFEKARWHVRDMAKKKTEFEKECEAQGIDPNTVSTYWYKSKRFSIKSNPTATIDYDKIFSNILSSKAPTKKNIEKPITQTADRLIFTDVHVGMDASRKGLAMYAEEWGKDMLMERIDIMAQEMINNKKSDILYIDELGDFMDGYNGQTTRGGHSLPQNMSNEEAFDTGLKAKLKLVELLQEHYNYIVFNNINVDNHSASFSYTVNSAFKMICDIKYNNVIVHNHRKFLNYYFVGDHCFIITHGKDDKHMKYGFKPVLDMKTVYKLNQFIKHEEINRKAKYIEISKGDSHQCLFDMCTSDDFHYFNYPAFSPSSEWVQTNFTKGRSGFVMQTIDLNSPNKSIYPYFFK